MTVTNASARKGVVIRFGMRSLILGITAFCVILGMFLSDAGRYTSRKNTARSMIRTVGGKIYEGISSEPPPGHNWLTNAFGLSNANERLWRVYLANTKITPAQVASLRGCEWIRSLDLSGTKLGDADVRFLSTLPKLREISLNRTLVTDGIVPTLRSLQRLLVLETKQTSVTGEGLKELEQAFETPRHFADFQLASLFPREGVSLSSETDYIARLRDEARGARLTVERTKSISISRVGDVSAETFNLLRGFSGVRSFQGSSRQDRFELYGIFRDLKEVRLISFSDGIPSESDIHDIANLKHLKYLWFFNSHGLSEIAAQSLGQIETLEFLTLGGVYGSLHLAPYLTNCKNLRILRLSAIRQGNARRLTPEELQNTIDLLQPLKQLPKLESLRISGNDMQDEVLLSLIEFPNIEQLHISRSLQGEFLSDEAIAQFRKARPDVEYLENGVGDSLELY